MFWIAYQLKLSNMKQLTYRQAYDKIIDAYFKDEIEPMKQEFCFCGTIAPNGNWHIQGKGKYPYSTIEYMRMESALLNKVGDRIDSQDYESDLFEGMSAALEVLKEIHRSRGENVDEPNTHPFTQRQLIVQ